jgi:hypothetical protein
MIDQRGTAAVCVEASPLGWGEGHGPMTCGGQYDRRFSIFWKN